MRNHFLRAAAGAGEVDRSWDIAYAEFTGTPKNWFYVGDQEASPCGLTFKTDGTQMYIVGSGSDKVVQYALSTAWDVSTASYTQSFSVLSQDGVSRGLFFKPDGTKMYVIGQSGDNVYEYNLSTAWDISTASYNQNFSVQAQDGTPRGVFFKDDGTEMYVAGDVAEAVHQYTLTTGWDVSTASFTQSFSVSTPTPTDLWFGNSGTKMYILDDAYNRVIEYTLSTAWDVSTASYVRTFAVLSQDSVPLGLFFKSDGTKMFMLGATSDAVWQYSLSTAYNIDTASFTLPTSEYLNVLAQDTNPQDIFFKPDGTRMYILGSAGDDVNEYSLSSAWDITTASYVQSFSITAQEILPGGLFFKPDGTKMYVTGYNSDNVNEYDLSTAWDVSTASYLQNFSVSAQEGAPRSLFFKPDGMKMYVIGTSADTVREYALSTAWDVSTASYSQGFSVSSQETNPQSVFFKPDGTKMYIHGESGDDVNEYNLSTAWDVSTASYVQKSGVTVPVESGPQGLFFKDDGTKFFTVGNSRDAVWAFTIS